MDIKLTDLVDTIIGSYKTYAQTEYDEESLKNLDSARELLIHITSRLCDNVGVAEKTTAWSVQRIGLKSRQILDEIQEMIDEI